MNSVLHAAMLSRPTHSKVKQMRDEQTAADVEGFPWTSALFHPHAREMQNLDEMNFAPPSLSVPESDSLISRVASNLRTRRAFYRWLWTVEAQHDVILLRYSVHDLSQLLFVLRRKGPVGFIHHANEEEELRGISGVVGWLRYRAEKLLGPITLRHSSIIIGVTSEIAEHERKRSGLNSIPMIDYPNGILKCIDVVDDLRDERPTLLFVASEFAPWHGLDLLLESIRQSQQDFLVHVVGKVPDHERRLVGADSRVVFHGPLFMSHIRGLAESCWLGVSTLASFRNGLTSTCSLKVRDYWSMGLPVYAGEPDVVPSGFPYFLVGRPDIEEILIAARTWQTVDRLKVAKAAEPFINKRTLLSKVYRHVAAIAK